MAQTTLGDGLIIGAGDSITFGDSTVLASSPTGGFKNKIIGGDFTTNPWQRGTSFTGPTSAYTADRFSVYNNTAAVVNVLKTADAPTAAEAGVYSQHCLHIDVTTADASIAAEDLVNIRQIIEGYNAASFGFGQSGTRYVTLSFWHKHTKTGTYCVSLFNNAANRSYVAEYTQTVTDTWEKAEITLAVDTAGTWLYDSGTGVILNWTVAAGATYQGTGGAWGAGVLFATANQVNALDSTVNSFKIALVQLEAGSVATPFETRSIGTELALCQRYLPAFVAGATGVDVCMAQCVSASAARSIYPFNVTPRVPPTGVTVSSVGHFAILNAAGSPQTCTSLSFTRASPVAAMLVTDPASGLVAGNAGVLSAINSSAKILFDGCEL